MKLLQKRLSLGLLLLCSFSAATASLLTYDYVGNKDAEPIEESQQAGQAGCNYFGESKIGQYRELHESAIVYLSNKQYLLTIMTRGNDVEKLSGVIGEISKLAYERMSAGKQSI